MHKRYSTIRTSKRWSDEEEIYLKQLVESGIGLKTIMALLGRTEDSIRNRMHTLGIGFRDIKQESLPLEEPAPAPVAVAKPKPTPKRRVIRKQTDAWVLVRTTKPSILTRFISWLRGVEWKHVREVYK